MRQPVVGLGEAAVEMLIDPAYRGGDRGVATSYRRLNYTIVPRESTAARSPTTAAR